MHWLYDLFLHRYSNWTGGVEMVTVSSENALVEYQRIYNHSKSNISDAMLPYPVEIQVSLSLALGLIILITVVGNFFVCFAIILERELRRPQNYLILSLAIADIVVGLTVMPVAAYYVVNRGKWTLGEIVCEIWISLDVCASTASILHLVAIALDRYWTITDILYAQKRTSNRIWVMVAVIWLVAGSVSIAPIFGWKDQNFHLRIELRQECLISQDLAYQIFSTTAAFYGPLVLIIVLYWKILHAARTRIRKHRRKPSPGRFDPKALLSAAVGTPETTELQSESPENSRRPSSSVMAILISNSTAVFGATSNHEAIPLRYSLAKLRRQRKNPKDAIEARRERKAFTTLAIVTGTFLVCWFPFFILALVRPIVKFSNFDLDTAIVWLGYINSLMNPVIYTIFAPDFRHAFARIVDRIFSLVQLHPIH